MQRLALMTVGFIVVFSVVPSLLPLEAVVVGFICFAGYLAWRIRPR